MSSDILYVSKGAFHAEDNLRFKDTYKDIKVVYL